MLTLGLAALLATLWQDHRNLADPASLLSSPPMQPVQLPTASSPQEVALPPLAEVEQLIVELASRPPRIHDAIRAAYHDSTDLYGFLMRMLPAASRGDGSAQYHLYLCLQECRAYLGPNGSATLEETTLTPFWQYPQSSDGISGKLEAERELWLREYARCKNFVGANMIALESALADDLPGDVTEYGPVWFERAVRAGYPLALAEMAYRPAFISADQRRSLLQIAVAQRDEQVFLTLFQEAWDRAATAVEQEAAVAWLLLACNAGLDCSEQAYWFQSRVCAPETDIECRTGQSALAHFWSLLPASNRMAAYATALRIETDLQAGRPDRLSWPNLP